MSGDDNEQIILSDEPREKSIIRCCEGFCKRALNCSSKETGREMRCSIYLLILFFHLRTEKERLLKVFFKEWLVIVSCDLAYSHCPK